MEKELQILMVEGDRADAMRLSRELRQQGVANISRRVETRGEFLQALQHTPPDVILAGGIREEFTGFAALELAQEKCPQVPFIFVTANAHQGMLVEMFDSGAAGCVCKSHLTDLGPVIRQALDEAREQSTSRCSLLAADSGAGPSTPTHQSEASDDPHLICSKCKQVRDDGGNWEDLEAHLRKHRQATVTLALCPACQSKRLEQWTLEGGNRR